MSDRRRIRAEWHDYNDGVYFVTVCCFRKKFYFGNIQDNTMKYSLVGQIARQCISEIPKHFNYVELWNYVVMPNHIHLVLAIGGVPQKQTDDNIGFLKPKRHEAPEKQDFHHNSALAVVVGQLKSSITRLAGLKGKEMKWQSKYYDNIISNKDAYDYIMNYIDNNVENWSQDKLCTDMD